MTLKQTLYRVLENSANNLKDDISSFQTMFNEVIKLGLPLLWDGNVDFYSKEQYQRRIKEKRNEEPEEELEGVISGNQDFERLRPTFQIWTRIKKIFKDMGPLKYEIYSKLELTLDNFKFHTIQMRNEWQLVTRYNKIDLPPPPQ